MLIYKVTCTYTKKIYIGLTTRDIEQRKRDHLYEVYNTKRKTNYFHDAIRKYGIDNFTWEILGYCDTLDELKQAEILCIDFFNSNNKLYGYNLTKGGAGILGVKWTEERRSAFSDKMTGRVISDETKEKISKKAKGRKYSQEILEKKKGVNLKTINIKELKQFKNEGKTITWLSHYFNVSEKTISNRLKDLGLTNSLKNYSTIDINYLQELREQGLSYRKIAVIVGIPHRIVYQRLNPTV